MSIKHMVAQDGNRNVFILPKSGGMRCDVKAFLSPELFAISETSLWDQARSVACKPGATGVYLMPDTHTGYELPIGGVLVTDDTIALSGSGYDISCGVIYLRVPGLRPEHVRSMKRRHAWIHAVEQRVPTGAGNQRPPLMKRFSESEIENMLRFGAQALGVDPSLCERPFIPISDSTNVREIARAWGRAQEQMGSIGSGNHFAEMQCDPTTGDVWIMIHCGSRGYGYQTADHFFHEAAAMRGLPRQLRHQSWVRLEEEVGRRYWEHHNAAANFAIANRHTIVRAVMEATEEIFGATCEVYFEISHNLVQEETLVLPDGSITRGFVHRKGATRAFPAGHPDLVGTEWESTGHPCLIPGSMKAGAAILFPLPGAYESGCSVCHGSGRMMARGEAVRRLAHKQTRINQDMANVSRTFADVEIVGIASNCKDIPLDECGEVYKDLDAVLDVLKNEGIARLEHRMFPIANIKAPDTTAGKKRKEKKKPREKKLRSWDDMMDD